jgi:hypothetical protein
VIESFVSFGRRILMGLGFRWFKDYKILRESYLVFGSCYYDEFSIDFIDSDETSHSYYNVGLVCDLFENTTGVSFPKLPNEEWIDSKDYKLNLIKPSDISTYCEMILNGTEVDNIDMRSRFEWFKNLSDDGYYIAYDYN